jgi:hypothetical protein
MRHLLHSLFNRNNPRFASTLFRGRADRSRMRNPQFISHLGAAGFRGRKRWLEEGAITKRQLVASAVAWAAALLMGWFVIESARALQIF